MAYDEAWLRDLFEGFGAVRLKRMFSGHGIYAGDFCIALAIRTGLCLRVDDENRAEMEALGAAPFTYEKNGKTVSIGKWWKLPETLLDEPDEIARLAHLSLAVAQRLPPKKPRVAKPRVKRATKKPG